MSVLVQQTESDGIVSLILNRPEKRNAMHGPLVQALTQALTQLVNRDDLRALILKGNGGHLCAGGDIQWMQKVATFSEDENYRDAQALADLLYQLHTFPVPTIVLATGAILGGGMGLVAACDIALASEEATFGFPEVKMGLTPSVISPYVIAAMGSRAARYYFLTGQRFSSDRAYQLGLVHQVVSQETLEDQMTHLISLLLQQELKALREAKILIREVEGRDLNESLSQKTAEHLAELRASPEAQAGLKAFLTRSRA